MNENQNWREFIQGLYSNSTDISPTFDIPASKTSIIETESILQVSFPSELIELLLETNGVGELLKTSKGQVDVGQYIWSISRIQKDNLFFRNSPVYRDIYMPFDGLFFFGDAGNGDCFGYSITGNNKVKTDIYCWNHEDDSRNWAAPSLKSFLESYNQGKIKT